MPLLPLLNITVPLPQARRLALVSVGVVVLLEIASEIVRGNRDAQSLIIALGFLLIPLSPALIALASPNPLIAVAAALAAIPILPLLGVRVGAP